MTNMKTYYDAIGAGCDNDEAVLLAELTPAQEDTLIENLMKDVDQQDSLHGYYV